MQNELARDAAYQLSLKQQKLQAEKAREKAEDLRNMREYQKTLEKER